MIGRKPKRKFSPPRSTADRNTSRSDVDDDETNPTKSTSHHGYNLRVSIRRPAYYDKPTHSKKSGGAKATKQPPSPNVKDNCQVDHCYDDAKLRQSQKADAMAKNPYLKDIHVEEECEGFTHKILTGVDGTVIHSYAYPRPYRTSYYSDDPDAGPSSPLPEGTSLFSYFFPGCEMVTTYIDPDEYGKDEEEDDDDEDEDEDDEDEDETA